MQFCNCFIFIYRLLGLCNNFGYVVMLSAAHDILGEDNNNQANHVRNISNFIKLNIQYEIPVKGGGGGGVGNACCVSLKASAIFFSYHYESIFRV